MMGFSKEKAEEILDIKINVINIIPIVIKLMSTDKEKARIINIDI